MLIRPIITTPIITIPEKYVEMIDVTGETGSREFTYKFTFSLNVTQALNKNALFLEIDLLSKKPDPPQARPAAVLPKSFRGSTKVLERTSQSLLAALMASRFAFSRSDITDVIPNSTASSIASGKKAFVVPLVRPTIPVLNTSLFALPMSSSLPRKTNVSLSKVSHSFISTQRDPAQMVSIKNSPPASLSFLKKADALRAQKVMFRPPKKIIAPKRFTVFSTKSSISRKIVLSEAVLGSKSKFYLRVKLKSNKGVTLSTTAVWCPHAKILNDFLTPTIPPELFVSQPSSGEMSVGISQIDPKATRVKLFRRIAPSPSSKGSEWKLILDQDLEVGEGDTRFRDPIASPNAIMYRALCLGTNSRSAEKFTSRVITPRKEIQVNYQGKGSATARLESTSIVVKVTDFPENAVSAGVRRYNLTTNSYSEFQAQKATGYIQVGATFEAQIQEITSQDDTLSFVDTPVSGSTPLLPGSIYKYVPVTYTLYGKEVIGKPAIIDFVSSESDNAKVALTVGAGRLASSKTGQSVSFTLAGAFTEFGFEEVEAVLSNANQAALFTGDISSNRSKFSSLITFLVERQNIKTGEVESFGVQESGPFTDNQESQQAKNIKPLESGTRYAYTVTACIRPAETLFPTIAAPEANATTLMAFTRSIQKFRGPMQLRKSTLASTARQTDSSAPSALEPSNPMLAGKTSIQSTVEIAIPGTVSKGSAASIEKRMTHTLIKWIYVGDVKSIDHFQVFLVADGGFELLGTVHADFSSSNFSFRHFLAEDVIYESKYFYEVKAIGLNFKEGQKMRTQSAVQQSFGGISPQLLQGAKVIQR